MFLTNSMMKKTIKTTMMMRRSFINKTCSSNINIIKITFTITLSLVLFRIPVMAELGIIAVKIHSFTSTLE
jgi:hypothetical protein